MVLLFDVLQVDALNDHGVFFGVQAGIDTEPANLRSLFLFLVPWPTTHHRTSAGPHA
jgi:hypothetical protein